MPSSPLNRPEPQSQKNLRNRCMDQWMAVPACVRVHPRVHPCIPLFLVMEFLVVYLYSSWWPRGCFLWCRFRNSFVLLMFCLDIGALLTPKFGLCSPLGLLWLCQRCETVTEVQNKLECEQTCTTPTCCIHSLTSSRQLHSTSLILISKLIFHSKFLKQKTETCF